MLPPRKSPARGPLLVQQGPAGREMGAKQLLRHRHLTVVARSTRRLTLDQQPLQALHPWLAPGRVAGGIHGLRLGTGGCAEGAPQAMIPHLADTKAILVLDETVALKKGDPTVRGSAAPAHRRRPTQSKRVAVGCRSCPAAPRWMSIGMSRSVIGMADGH